MQAISKFNFTDRGLKALKAPRAGRATHWDAGLPNFGVRVTFTGSACFIVMRYVDRKLLRRSIGRPWHVPLPKGAKLPTSLEAARDEARQSLADMARGVDPKEKRKAQVRVAARLRENTFASVADAFIADHVVKLRSAKNVTAHIRKVLIPAFGERPIGEITRPEMVALIRDIKKRAPHSAYHALAYARKLFAWAIVQDVYGLESSPCDRIFAKDLIGQAAPRDRVLADNELAAIWHATDTLGVPFGPFVRMLMITGQRRSEVAQATWGEIDLDNALWTIPPERMKGDAAHLVPLSPPAVKLLRELHKTRGAGEFVFMTTDGKLPISAFSQNKVRLDGMLESVAPWRFHDLRRTVRTGLGGLKIATTVAELVIAHAQPGLHKTYDRHSYQEEKRHALNAWADKLMDAVEQDTSKKVVKLSSRRK